MAAIKWADYFNQPYFIGYLLLKPQLTVKQALFSLHWDLP